MFGGGGAPDDDHCAHVVIAEAALAAGAPHRPLADRITTCAAVACRRTATTAHTSWSPTAPSPRPLRTAPRGSDHDVCSTTAPAPRTAPSGSPSASGGRVPPGAEGRARRARGLHAWRASRDGDEDHCAHVVIADAALAAPAPHGPARIGSRRVQHDRPGASHRPARVAESHRRWCAAGRRPLRTRRGRRRRPRRGRSARRRAGRITTCAARPLGDARTEGPAPAARRDRMRRWRRPRTG